MNYGTQLLRTSSDVPDPPPADRFRASGLSVICYVAHRVESAEVADAVEAGRLATATGPNSYAAKLRPGSNLVYSALRPCGELRRLDTTGLGVSAGARLSHAALWLGDDYVLSAVPLILSVGTLPHRFATAIPAALTVQQTLGLLGSFSADAVQKDLVQRCSETLVEILGPASSGVRASWFLDDSVGIQVWDLGGTDGRPPDAVYRGAKDSLDYSWEISALLSYNVDHMSEPGLWLRRNPQQVVDSMNVGYAFLDDHMVFSNPNCCLEMTHLPAWLRDRSRWRLETYGYDSSALFIWSVAMLRYAAISDLGGRYREDVDRLSRDRALDMAGYAEILRRRLRHESYLSCISSFDETLIEPRNRALCEVIDTQRGMDRALQLTQHEMSKSDQLAQSAARSADQATRERRTIGIAAVGLLLAVVGIPDMVRNFTDWYRDGDWAPATIACLLILTVIIAVPTLLRMLR